MDLPAELYPSILCYQSSPSLKQCSLANKIFCSYAQPILFSSVSLGFDEHSTNLLPHFLLTYNDGHFIPMVKDLTFDLHTIGGDRMSDYQVVLRKILPQARTLSFHGSFGTRYLPGTLASQDFSRFYAALFRLSRNLTSLVIDDFRIIDIGFFLVGFPHLTYLETRDMANSVDEFSNKDIFRTTTCAFERDESRSEGGIHVTLNQRTLDEPFRSSRLVPFLSAFEKRHRPIWSLRIGELPQLYASASLPVDISFLEPIQSTLRRLHLPSHICLSVKETSPRLPLSSTNFPLLTHLSLSTHAMPHKQWCIFFTWLQGHFISDDSETEPPLKISHLTLHIPTSALALTSVSLLSANLKEFDACQACLPVQTTFILELEIQKTPFEYAQKREHVLGKIQTMFPRWMESGLLHIRWRCRNW
ncbi:hypothetical protein DL96DRAFT_1590865 [Flagelloscypha sp. PMI_526]|nr:hypothetical protein DL96DRAFT_1590865 [Flagelloscypha sp. PMI_526]